MSAPSFFPLVVFDRISLHECNHYLLAWEHRIGPLRRGRQGAHCYALFHHDKPVAVTATSSLITPHVGGGLAHLTRDNTVELSRLCASRSDLCRVALRLWREFVFPALGYRYAISYQDADMHNGHTYRFDGWKRAAYVRGAVDKRSGRPARNKWIWVWENPTLTDSTVNVPCHEEVS